MKSWISLCFGFLFVSTVMGTSFLNSKQRYYNFLVRSRARGQMYAGKEIKGKECKDLIKDDICTKYQRYCGTAYAGSKVLRKHCPKSCGLCRAFSPPVDCKKSTFGCCWDNITFSQGMHNEGCPACVDIDSDCELLSKHCYRVDVKRICPMTCGVCGECLDDPFQKIVCPFYKQFGFCTVDPNMMAKHCKKTCGLC